MSGSSQNPAAGVRDASVEHQQRQMPEAMPYSEVRRGIDTLDRAADSAHDRLSDISDLNAMIELRSDLAPSEQLEGLTLLQSRLINVLTRIAKANPKIKLERVKPGELMRDAELYGVRVTPDEIMAWQKYMELISRPGPTAKYLIDAWRGRNGEEGILDEAEAASKGFVGKLGKFAHDHPGRTLVYAAAGVAGVYIGYKLITGIWGWFTKDETEGGPKESFWQRLTPSKKTALAIAAIAAAAGLSIADRKGLLRQLLMDMTPDEVREFMERGEALPAKVRREIEETKAEVERLRAQVEGTKGKAAATVEAAKTKASEVVEETAETLSAPQIRQEAIIETLVGLYAVKNINLSVSSKGAIQAAMRGPLAFVRVEKIADVYYEHKDNGKIDPEAFGVEFDHPQAKEALFHAAKIVTLARDYYAKAYSRGQVDGLTLQDFLVNHVANDPAHSFHDAFLGRLQDLHLTDLLSLRGDKLADLFDWQEMSDFFKTNLNAYVENLARRLKVEVPQNEKGAFLRAVAFLYGGKINLNLPEAEVLRQLDTQSLTPTVKKAALNFFKAIKKDFADHRDRILEFYDIERADDKTGKYDKVLNSALTENNLLFSHAFQLSVVMEGINWDAAEKSGEFERGKDVAMLMLISKILKDVAPDAHMRYMANVAAAIAGNIPGLNLHLHWQALQPYLKFGLEQIVERSKKEAKHWWEFVTGMPQPSKMENFDERLMNADFVQFAAIWTQEATFGAISFPRRLIIKIIEKCSDLFNETTDGVSVLKMALAIGGVLFFSKTEGGENTGVLYLAGEYFFIKPAEILWDTIKGKFNGVAIKTYLIGTSPYIAIGMIGGLIHSRSVASGAINALRGARRGLAMPITAPIAGYRAVRGVYRWGERAYGITRAGFNTVGHMPLMQRSNELFLRYWGRVYGTNPSTLDVLEDLPHGPARQGRMLIYQDLYQASARRWADLFVRDYYHFFGINPTEKDALNHVRFGWRGKAIKLTHTFENEDLKLTKESDLNAIVKRALRIRKVMEELKKISPDIVGQEEFLTELRRIAQIKHGEGTLLEAGELESLTHQVKDAKQFKRLRQMIAIARRETIVHKAAKAVSGGARRATARSSEWLHDRKWYQDFEKWRGAKFAKADLDELAKMSHTQDSIASFLKSKKIPPELAERMAARIADAKDAAEIERIIKEMAETEKLTVKFAQELKVLGKLGRFAGRFVTGAGVAINGILAYQAFREAATASDASRRRIQAARGTVFAANVPADIALYALAGSAGGAAAGASLVGGAGLAAFTYMADSALESKYEATKTVAEWALEEQRQLIHDWISTTTLGAGEAYRLLASQEKIGREKKEIIRRIAAAILCQQDKSQAADPDRMHYLEVVCNFRPPANYRDALNLLRDSRIYANLIQSRRQAMAAGEPVVIGSLDVSDSRFENPDRQAIEEMLRAYRTEMLASIAPELKQNFNRFSNHYLIGLCCEAFFLNHGKKANTNEKEFTNQLERYLTFVRGIDMKSEYIAWFAEKKKERKLDDKNTAKLEKSAREHIAEFQEKPADILREDMEHYTASSAVNALMDLALFFGYTGYPNEDELKKFFDKNHKGVHGVYWDGDEWCLNEAGYELDEDLGDKLDENVVRLMIKIMREKPDDVIETRQQAVVDVISIHQFEDQVKQMADILENGLKKKPRLLSQLQPASAPLWTDKPASAPTPETYETADAEAEIEQEDEMQRAA